MISNVFNYFSTYPTYDLGQAVKLQKLYQT
jgi:hypothetical protein